MGIAIAVGGYILFDLTLRYMASTDTRERALAEATRLREEEWLQRVGSPARLELGLTETDAGTALVVETVKAIRPGSDLTIMRYFDRDGGRSRGTEAAAEQIYAAIMEQLNRGTIREYKRLICFDHEVLANDPELKSGILRVGEGSGFISRVMAEHCRAMMQTKGCSVYVAPAVLRIFTVSLFGTDKVSMTVDTAEPESGTRAIAGLMFFYDPPNGEIIEQFRQIERATERRMVAVHKIRFPEDEAPTASPATLVPLLLVERPLHGSLLLACTQTKVKHHHRTIKRRLAAPA